MSKQVEEFHQLVLRNRVLTERLRTAVDRKSFVQLAVQVGAEHGYSFTHREVEAYVNRNMITLMQQFS